MVAKPRRSLSRQGLINRDHAQRLAECRLEYLYDTDKNLYDYTLNEFSKKSLWEVTEVLSETFNKNPLRLDRYWHNKAIQEKYALTIQKCPYKINIRVFNSLRKELYTSENKSLDFDSINFNWHLVIGYHDYVMSGHLHANNKNTHILFNSAHYPHLEENQLFCRVINESTN